MTLQRKWYIITSSLKDKSIKQHGTQVKGSQVLSGYCLLHLINKSRNERTLQQFCKENQNSSSVHQEPTNLADKHVYVA